MAVHFQINIDGETTEDAIADFKRVFDGLCSGEAKFVPTAANEALKNAGAAEAFISSMQVQPAKSGEVIEPEKPKKTRAKKEPVTIDADPLDNASTAENQEFSSASEADSSSDSASDAPSAPDVQAVRDKLKVLGATDGLGHDAAFKVLGKYGAKNASTVPEDKRAAIIADIDELLAGAK